MDHEIEVTGGRLFAVEAGAGSPLVLIHAAIADHRQWAAMVPGLVAAGHRVIRYDLRGFGRSTTEDVAFSHRADLVALLDALGIDRAVLVANSFGGMVAFETAVVFPERVAGIVAVAAGLPGFPGEPNPAEMALFDEMDALEEADPRDPDAIVAIDLRIWVNGPFQLPDRVDPAIQAAVREMDRPQYVAGHVSGRPDWLDPRVARRLGELRAPILAVAGELDASTVAQTARHLEANAPDARAVIMPGVAHLIGMEAPTLLNELVLGFVANLDARD
jgi:pimeloyl-ACP methyl ester carboxylesterase